MTHLTPHTRIARTIDGPRLRLALAAESLRAAYARRAHRDDLGRDRASLPEIAPHLLSLVRTDRLLRRARSLGWSASAARLRLDYERSAHILTELLGRARGDARSEQPSRPTARQLLAELEQSDEEFGGLGIDEREARLWVCTRPITLEGVALGRFRIVLDIGALDRADPADWYRIDALEPNPSGVSDTVTHPHVDGEHLCAGEALLPIRHALLHGRLADFFLMVRGVLEHYNPHSAYVRLEEWDGVRCHECDAVMAADCSSFCDCCERDFCSDCVSSCEGCGETTCNGCLEESELSGALVCSGCRAHCDDCDRLAARDEIDGGLCSACAERATAASHSSNSHSNHEEVPHGTNQTRFQSD